MRKAYILRKLTEQVRSFAAFMLITLLAVGNVFAEYDGTGTFTKINSADELTTGYYVVTNQSGEFAMSNAVSTGNTKFIIRENAVFTNPAANIVWLVTVDADGNVTLFNEDEGAYAAYPGSGNTAYTITTLTDNGLWTPSLDSDGNWVLENVAVSGRYLNYNPGSPRFACYGNHNQDELSFYKLNDGGETPAVVVAAPTFSIPTGTYYTEQTVSLTAEEGANIYYSINGEDPILYNAPLTVGETSTIVAYAEVGETHSANASITLTFPIQIANIAAFYEGTNNTLYTITGDVQFVWRNGSNMYVQDPTGALLIYDQNNNITTGYNNGDIISGGLTGTVYEYNQLIEMKPTLNTAEGTPGDAVVPVEVSVADILANPDNYMSKLVVLRGGTFAAGSFHVGAAGNIDYTQDESTIVVRSQFKNITATFTANEPATVVGFVGRFNNTIQLFPRSAADIIPLNIIMPYSCNFESFTAEAWNIVNGDNTNKWYIGTAQGFDNNKLYISSSNGVTNKYNVSAASVSHAYAPITLPEGDVLLTFDVRTVGDANDYLQVSVMDEVPEAGTLPEEYLTRIYGVNEFTTQTVVIPASYAGEKYLVFTWNNNNAGGNQQPAAIDNIVLKNTCEMVTDIEAEVNEHTAVLTWTAPEGQNSWTVEYKIANSDVWESVNVTEATLTLNDLTTDIDYDVRIRSNCGDAASNWATAEFFVPCINVTMDAVDVTIGDGTATTYYGPFGTFYKNAWVQMIYPASNFETPGYINSLSWEVNAAVAHDFQSLKIYLGTTTHENNTSTTDWLPMEDLTLVYEAENGTLGSAAGWETFVFNNPYFYDAVDNLVVVVSRKADNYKSLYYKSTSGNTNSVMYRWNDSNASYGDHPGTATASGRNANLPNMKIDYTGYVCGDDLCRAPKNLVIDNHIANTTVTWVAAPGVETYEVQFAEAGSNNWNSAIVNEASTFIINGLVEGVAYDVRVRSLCGEESSSAWIATSFTRPIYCNPVTGITAENVTSNAATLTWDAGEANSWTVEFGENGFTLGEGTQVTTGSTMVTIMGFDPETTYQVYVKANCGGYMAAWSNAYTFTTDCAPYTVTETTPWFEDFEGYTGSGEKPFKCWATPVKASYGGPFVYCGYSSSCHSGANSAELKGYDNVLVLPVFTNDIHTLNLSFWATAVTPTDGTLEVGVLTDINDMDSFEFVAYATEPSSRDGVGNYMGPFSFADVTADGGRIALRYHSDYGTSNSWNLDDFTVYIPQSCPAPMNLVADVNVLEQEAEITWVSNGEENEWEVQYGAEGFVLGTGTIETVAEASFSMTDLPDGTSYDVYVRAICSETESSDWAGPVTFEIPAACTQYCAYTLNLADSYSGADGWNGGTLTISQNGVVLGTYTIENGSASATFDLELCNDVVAEFLYTAGSYANENSWQLLDSEGEVVLSGVGTGSSGESFTQTVTPSCAASSGCENSCEYTFEMTDEYGYGWAGYYGEGAGSLDVIQNGELVTTLTMETGYTISQVVSLCDATETTIILHPDYFAYETTFTVYDPAGNVVLAFDGSDLSGFGSDPDQEFTFTTDCSAAPACSTPTDLVVTEVTENSASLAWTGDEELTYEVSYKTGVDADWTAITVTGTQVTLTDLTANITYFARVKAVCDLNDNYAGVVNFFTSAVSVGCDTYEYGVGTTTTQYDVPVNNYYRNSYTQQIFTPEEVGGTGNISSLAFNYSYSSAMTAKTNVIMYLAVTDKEIFENTSDWVTDGLVQVYAGSLNCTQGWNTFTFDQPFYYDGTSNLVVVVEDNSGSYNSSSYKFYTSTENSTSKALVFYNDNNTFTPTGSSRYVRNYRNNIRFGICDVPADDIQLTAIHNIPNACDLSNIPVTIDIKNGGTNNVNTIQAYYSVNGATTVHETIALLEPLALQGVMTYTFNTLANLPEASNTITAWVEVLNDANSSNNMLTTDPINLIEPAELPFVETFNAGEINDGWFVRDINGDGITFEIANGVATYTYNDEMDADDWLMTSCMYMSAGFWEPGIYEVAYSYKALDATMVENFGVYYGKKVGDEYVMNNTVATHEFNNTDFVTVRNYIIVNQGGVYYFGIHAESQAGNAGFQINDFSVKPALHFTANAADHGTVIPDGTVVYAEGDPYTLTIVPDPGYHVLAIYKNMSQVRGENTDNAGVEYYTFTPNDYDNIYVTFTANEYVVNATVENLYETDYNNNAPGATYTPNHETVAHGGSHTGTIVVDDNYNINAITVNGMDVRSSLVPVGNNEYELTVDPIYENKNIHVVVGLDSASITYFVEGYGTINNTFVVDADTEIPLYRIELPGNSNLLSTFVPAEGYHVDNIIIDGVEHSSITAYSFEHLFGDHLVLVNFVPNHYTITTAAYGNGTVSEGEEFDYDPEKTYIFEATPEVGYRIGSIMRNNVALDVENPTETYTETLTNILSDYNYEVMFVPNTYTITASCGENGTISPNGVSNYYYHQDAEVVITADLGYYISSVTYDEYTYELPQNDFLTTLTIPFFNIESCHTISATFAQFTYNITVNAGAHGEITPGTDSYNFGETPTFAIAPDAGYVISDVTVDGESVGAVSTYTFLPLNSDHTIAATFAAQAFTITATAGDGGTITPSGVTNVAYNANQTYTISASTGYHVNDVMVDGASVGAVTSYTFSSIKANHTIFVTFAANDYTITVTQPDHGAITPGTTTVNHGADQAFVIAPNVGYKVSEIKVNNSNVALSSVPNVNGIYTYTFENVTDNKTLTATMEAKTYTISASAGANGSITPNGNKTVTYGGSQIYTITPDAGYVVDHVVVDNINMGAMTGYTFTNVTANHTISVTFKPVECEDPSFLYTSHISCNSAELHWSHPSAGITFDIRYKIYPDGALTSVSNVSGNSYELTGLTANTTYLWQVRANCSSTNHSEWSNMVSFTTESATIIGVEDLVKNNIKVYAEHQNVHILNNEGMNIENVRIFDAYGKLIYSGAVNTSHEVINLNVAAGTYIVNVTTDEGVANYKVILMK